MAIRIPWDIYEAVILLDSYLKVRNDSATKLREVKRVSQELRKKAVSSGIEIDDIFRNINGISFQMQSMATAFEGENRGKDASSLFIEIVKLYREDNDSYQRILEEAKKMINGSANQKEAFFEYVATEQPKRARDIYLAMEKVDEYAIRAKVLNTSFYEKLSINTVELLNKRVVANKFFSVRNKKILNSVHTGMALLCAYVIENNDVLNDTENKIFAIDNTSYEDSTVNTQKSVSLQSPSFSNRTALNDTMAAKRTIDFNNVIVKQNCNSTSDWGSNDEADMDKYKSVLSQRFVKGFRLSSNLDLRKFKAFYKEILGEEAKLSDDEIKRLLKHCGIVYEDKLFLAENMLSKEKKEKLFLYIENLFNSEKNAIYYDALYKEFEEDFSSERIYNADMLKTYLENTTQGKYHFSRAYMSLDAYVRFDFIDEIRTCLMKHGTPVSKEILYNELSHIPHDKIDSTLAANSEFIRNSKGIYFHCSLINFGDDDVNDIAHLISEAIDDKEYIAGTELIEAIQKKYPSIIDNNSMLSQLGLRGAIAYTLGDKFAFDSNVISKRGHSLSMSDVYADFSKNKERFTIDELKLLKTEINSGIIYFDSVYANSLRVSDTTFVARNKACFDIHSTDTAIEMFMGFSDYMPLQSITSFGAFPYAGHPWNIFLLEHYVAEFSEKFKLIHSTYNESKCAGAIVRKTTDINSFDELVALALSDSQIVLTTENALDFLCNEGYLAVRRYKGTAQALIKAQEIRNKKGTN